MTACVEYQANGSKCDVSIRRWDMSEKPPRARNPDCSAQAPTIKDIDNTVPVVDRTNLTAIHKEKLR